MRKVLARAVIIAFIGFIGTGMLAVVTGGSLSHQQQHRQLGQYAYYLAF